MRVNFQQLDRLNERWNQLKSSDMENFQRLFERNVEVEVKPVGDDQIMVAFHPSLKEG